MALPKITIKHLVAGAREARGLVVIIDVFRAFSVACYAFDRGAKMIIPVGEIETALALKQANPDIVLVGERGGRPLPGFEYGNSPSQIQYARLTGKTVVHTTSNGTQGIVNAVQADEIITGSFVNAAAIASYIQTNVPTEVTLVCMGRDNAQVVEDTLCAQYLRDLILGNQPDFERAQATILVDENVQLIRNSTYSFFPASDLDLCLSPNRFSFVLSAKTSTIADYNVQQLEKMIV